MRILVLGAYGMLGHRLLLSLSKAHNVIGTCRVLKPSIPDKMLPRKSLIEGIDARDISSVRDCISQAEPEVAINCIGIIKQSPLSSSPIQSIQINSLFPHQLANICADQGVRTIHFSTDCVFSGTKGGYRQDDPHDATDLYGRSKSLGELGRSEGLTLRSSIVGRELDSSFGLLEWFAGSRGKTVSGYTNVVFSGLTSHEMANVVECVLERKDLVGVWQVASTPISKYELLKLVNDRLNLDVEIRPDSDFHCDRSLDGRPFTEETEYTAPTWGSMVDQMATDWMKYDHLRTGVERK